MATPITVKVAIDKPLFQLFDYTWDVDSLQTYPCLGQIVKVEFGKKLEAGIVLQENVTNTCASDQKRILKPVLEVAPHIQVSQQIINLCQFASRYYLKPIGEVLFSSLPANWKRPEKWPLLEKQNKKYILKKEIVSQDASPRSWNLNQEQLTCYEYLCKASLLKKYELILLKGVTGSGKTAVYLQWLKEVLQDNSAQCLILVPEINLTPQLERTIKGIFVEEQVTVLHSNITSLQRNLAWLKIQNGLSRVIVGTRLSIFAPIPNLKAIVVDEEHDNSYKQQDGLRYNARDLAIWRAAELKIPLVLTSATPSSETWQKVINKKMTLLTLTQKAKWGASIAKVHVLDVARARKNKQLDEYGFSSDLLKVIKETWQKKLQTLIYINRRGYAPILFCGACNWKSACEKCSAWMVVHKKKNSTGPKILHCHHCGANQYAPVSCPDCGNQDLSTIGMGTQKIEEHLEKLFPEIEIVRVDSDTSNSKGGADANFERIHQGTPLIIIGTQMIIKGHDFQNIESIIVLDVDKSLFSQDFRAIEKIHAQLVQVAGRAGRSDKTEQANIYIQTEFVDHPIFKALEDENDVQFITNIVKERESYLLPPHTHQALIIAESKSEQSNKESLTDLKNYLEADSETYCQISDPMPRVLQRLSGQERNQILIESTNRQAIQTILERALDYIETMKKNSRSIKFNIDRDPIQF